VSGYVSGPRFLIADDHAIFAEVLRGYLEKTYTVVGVVSDGPAMVSEAIRLQPDLIVVDVGMPLLNGLDAAWRIRKQAPNIKFIFGHLARHPRQAYGKPYLTPKLRAEDWVATKVRARQYSKEMTPRQKGIVQLLAEGRPNKEIADILALSEKTVEFHKRHIKEAFNLHSNADVVLFALKQGLISMKL